MGKRYYTAKKSTTKTKSSTRRNKYDSNIRSCWVDQIRWIPIEETETVDAFPVDEFTCDDNDLTDDTKKTSGSMNDSNKNKIEPTASLISPSSSSLSLSSPSISIISWNVLAASYCSIHSHRNLPQQYQSHVFDPTKRSKDICTILQRQFIQSCHVDIICLQEVDTNQISKVLTTEGYNGVETPRTTASSLSSKTNNSNSKDRNFRTANRVDACAVYVNERSSCWKIQSYEIIHLDDLATKSSTSSVKEAASTATSTSVDDADDINTSPQTLLSSSLSQTTTETSSTLPSMQSKPLNHNRTSNNKNHHHSQQHRGTKSNATTTDVKLNQHKNSNSSNNSSNNNTIHNHTNIQGIQQAFLRRNVALLVRIQHKSNPKITIVIANAHLFWNPSFEYVKLCQAHYILQRAKSFCSHDKEPFIFCGDLNSRPNGITHTYLSRGTINAKLISPWYASTSASDSNSSGDSSQSDNNVDPTTGSSTTNPVETNAVRDLAIKNSINNHRDPSENGSKIRRADQACTNVSVDPCVKDEEILSNDELDEPMEDCKTTATNNTQDDDGDGSLPESMSKLALYKETIREQENLQQNRLQVVGTKGHIEQEQRQKRSMRMRYILDATLNKLCRWLRILGQDACLESEQEEQLRTSEGNMILFNRCRNENRTLVTTSTRLLYRRDCPTSVYCISPQLLPRLEVALVHMLLTHGVVLEPSTFLSRCVVCNGSIIEVHPIHEKKRILAEYQAPSGLLDKNEAMAVSRCNICGQGYWWCEGDRPTSSASRVKNTASELFELCLRAGVPCIRNNNTTGSHRNGEDDDEDMFTHLDEELLRSIGWDFSIPGSELLRQQLDVVGWMKSEQLLCPFRLVSAYATTAISNAMNKSEERLDDDQADHTSTDEAISSSWSLDTGCSERLPFTNVTYDFVSTLDYIFFCNNKNTGSSNNTNETHHHYYLDLIETLYVPMSFPELNHWNISKGHLLPSDVWPSDHLAVGAKFVFLNHNNTTDDNGSTSSSSNVTKTRGKILDEDQEQSISTMAKPNSLQQVQHHNIQLDPVTKEKESKNCSQKRMGQIPIAQVKTNGTLPMQSTDILENLINVDHTDASNPERCLDKNVTDQINLRSLTPVIDDTSNEPADTIKTTGDDGVVPTIVKEEEEVVSSSSSSASTSTTAATNEDIQIDKNYLLSLLPTSSQPRKRQQQHNARCGCGCVPAIPSLFEMAELRRRAKEKQQLELTETVNGSK